MSVHVNRLSHLQSTHTLIGTVTTTITGDIDSNDSNDNNYSSIHIYKIFQEDKQ